MKVLGFAASNSSKSINKKLVHFAISYFKEEQTEILDLNDYEMPIFSIDREEKSGIPSLAQEFAGKIIDSDLILISYAEHNGAYTAAYKNVFDWVSRIKDKEVWRNKKLFLMATSPGDRGGQSVLKLAVDRMPRHGAIVLDTFSLPNFFKSFSEGKGIFIEELRASFEEKIKELLEKD